MPRAPTLPSRARRKSLSTRPGKEKKGEGEHTYSASCTLEIGVVALSRVLFGAPEEEGEEKKKEESAHPCGGVADLHAIATLARVRCEGARTKGHSPKALSVIIRRGGREERSTFPFWYPRRENLLQVRKVRGEKKDTKGEKDSIAMTENCIGPLGCVYPVNAFIADAPLNYAGCQPASIG